MNKRFVLVPGYVFSENDHERHWIGARQLASLYRVPTEICHIINECDQRCCMRRLGLMKKTDLIWLGARQSGNYDWCHDEIKKIIKEEMDK